VLKLLCSLVIFCVCYTIIYNSFFLKHYCDLLFYLWMSLSLLISFVTVSVVYSMKALCHCTVSWTAAHHVSYCSFWSGYCIAHHHVPSWQDHLCMCAVLSYCTATPEEHTTVRHNCICTEYSFINLAHGDQQHSNQTRNYSMKRG
jgi:hypothetical protein